MTKQIINASKRDVCKQRLTGSSAQAKRRLLALASFLIMLGWSSYSAAQSVEDVRWKSADQVRAAFGDPLETSNPVGTHATYVLWKYESFTVAFANDRAFHLFNKDSLRKVKLEESRTQ